MNRITLRFADSRMETEFAGGQARKSRRTVRIALLCATPMLLAQLMLVVTQPQMVPGATMSALIALIVILPLLYATTYMPLFLRQHQASLSVLSLVGSLGIMVLMGFLPFEVFAARGFFIMTLHLFSIYCLFGLRFPMAVVTSLLSIATYLTYFSEPGWLDSRMLGIHATYLSIANLWGMVICYQIDLATRREFLATNEVTAQAAQISELNLTLEQRVDEQVDQIGRLGKLKRFFSPQLADVIVAGGEEALKTHRREVSVVFIDLRGFTAFTDKAEPEEVMDMLRAFHATMGRIVMEHNGTLERFAGDSVMVFFNDPVPMENHAEQAVLMAMEMQAAFVTLGEKWQQRGFNLGLGCGISLGYATLGEIGFEGRWDYAAIGSVTNLAARLCAEAASGEVLVDQKMMDKVGAMVSAAEKGSLTLKGFAQPVQTFSLTGLKL